MNVFFELADCVVDDAGKYFAVYGVRDATGPGRYIKLMRNSERVWGETDDGTVYFIKHRQSIPHDTLVDMKEFFWIKLKSVTV
jgi:hypothetical protein